MLNGFTALSPAIGDPMLFLAKAVIVGAIVATVVYLIHSRCRRLIVEWAGHGGWDVVSVRRQLLGAPSFAFVPGMPVYRVVLRSRSGREREAYVRCGNLLSGVLLSDEVAVEWVEAA